MEYTAVDLSSDAFGMKWGQTRSYANVLSSHSSGVNGNGWLVRQLSYLVFVDADPGDNDPDKICLMDSANNSIWFTRLLDGSYQATFGTRQVLSRDGANRQFILTQPNGEQVLFFDNSISWAPGKRGLFRGKILKTGVVIMAEYDESNRLVSIVQGGGTSLATGYFYDYFQDGPNVGRMASVTLQVSGATVRRVEYNYYDGTDSGGNQGDLKSAVVQQYDSGRKIWLPVRRSQYRYYLPGDPNGFMSGLKFIVEGSAYEAMEASGLDPVTAPDATLANFANFYYEYESGTQRVSLEKIEGGRKEYSFEYIPNTDESSDDGVNQWAMLTVEQLPDGNSNRVYTNAAFQVLLKISNSGPDEWYEYCQYDNDFHLILKASSFAVQSVVEDPDLVVVLKEHEGLIEEQVYYSSTNSATGAVAGYLEKTTVRQGTAEAAKTIRRLEYVKHEAFGQVIYPIRANILYPVDGGDDSTAARTSYHYTWYETNPPESSSSSSSGSQFSSSSLTSLSSPLSTESSASSSSSNSTNPTFQVQQKIIIDPVVATDFNGSGIAGVSSQYFDTHGNLTWQKNQRGVITFMAYDQNTSAMVQRIDDVDTSLMSNVPSGWATVPGFGQHLITDFVNDSQGRQVQERGPWHEVQLRVSDTVATAIRRVRFTAFLDTEHEVRRASGYMTGEEPTADFHIVDSVSVTRTDESGKLVDQIQSVRSCTCGPLTTGEPFPQEKWSRWEHRIYDTWDRLYALRTYFKIPSTGEGEEGANYLETLYGYDVMNRQNRVVDPTGTISRIVFDSRGLALSNWVGTNDDGATDDDPTGGGSYPSNNMTEVATMEYDDGEPHGNGNLTEQTLPVDDESDNDRITEYGYDFRNRLIEVTTTDGATSWLTETGYDNLDRPTEVTRYKIGTPNVRIGHAQTFYDKLGRIYRNTTDGVNPSTGTIVGTLVAQNWYDLVGNVIKQSQQGNTAFTKTAFDGLNRATVSYLACVPGYEGVPSGDDNDVTDDTVIEQNETAYDDAGNVILTTLRQRFDDAIHTGALGDVDTEPKARVSFKGLWPDALGRPQSSADFGTNGGAPLARPEVAPQRSEVILVTTNHYKDTGEANAVRDPMGFETRWENDQMGRRIKLVENFVPACPEKSRTSYYAWHPSGQLQRLTLVNDDTGDQITQWIYGVTLQDSNLASNNLLRAKIYPESDDRPAPLNSGPDGVYCRLEYTYNRQGQGTMFKDADEVLHSYTYDKLGRLLDDSVTLPEGSDLDDSILRISRSYEVRGMLEKVTSYDAATAGTIVNESEMAYDAFGNLISDKQSGTGAVGEDTPEVGYSYEDTSSGNNTTRRTATTYPDGRVINVLYGEEYSVDDHLSRVSGLQDAAEESPLVTYTYVGAAWQVIVDYPQPDVQLTYKKQGDEPVGDAGDPYNGYDRFGRTVDIRWQKLEA